MDVYEPIPPPQGYQERMHRKREGKWTVALVGMSPAHCAWAPWDDLDVEIWALNEMHAWDWVKRANAWFQLHPKKSFTREVAVRNVRGHYEWLQEDHSFPIYMQKHYDEIPDSAAYPLDEIVDLYFKNIYKGEQHPVYFTVTFSYMMAYALKLGFQRIEIYGFDMGGAYSPQRSCAEFWIGLALGTGKEIYLPETCKLIEAPLYAYQGMGADNHLEKKA